MTRLSINGHGWELQVRLVMEQKGLVSLSTLPGDRVETSTAWVDTSGNLWLFGGLANGFDLNDMWQYNVSSGIWTWMSGTNLNNNAGTYGTFGPWFNK